MQAFDEASLQQMLVDRPLWRLENGKLVREWRFANFVAAMAFANRVAALAEAAGHHPDIDIRYNRVRLGLVTHDAGGVTERDVAMAAQLDAEFPA